MNFNMHELFHLPETPPQRQGTEAAPVPNAREVSASRDGQVLPPESPVYNFLKLCFMEKTNSLQPTEVSHSPLAHLEVLLSLHLSASPNFTAFHLDPSQSLLEDSSQLASALQPTHFSLSVHPIILSYLY